MLEDGDSHVVRMKALISDLSTLAPSDEAVTHSSREEVTRELRAKFEAAIARDEPLLDRCSVVPELFTSQEDKILRFMEKYFYSTESLSAMPNRIESLLPMEVLEHILSYLDSTAAVYVQTEMLTSIVSTQTALETVSTSVQTEVRDRDVVHTAMQVGSPTNEISVQKISKSTECVSSEILTSFVSTQTAIKTVSTSVFPIQG